VTIITEGCVETDEMLAFQKKSLYVQLAAQNIYVFITRERKGQKKEVARSR
jgi:hypothetical protein